MKKKQLILYLLRLRKASLPELAYRAKEALILFWLRYNYRQIRPTFQPSIQHVKCLKIPTFQYNKGEKLCNKIFNGEPVGSYIKDRKIQEIGRKYTKFYFSDLQKNVYDGYDIRMIWEPSRLQHVSLLLLHLNDEPNREVSRKLHDYCKKIICCWILENEFPKGLNYVSAMECALRIPIFFYALKILNNLDEDTIKDLYNVIFQHAWFISKRLSLFSSLGNHTIAEAVGLIIGGAIFNDRLGNLWLAKGISILNSEVKHQILDDGGPAEQSFNYHRFVLDLYWLAVQFLEINNLYRFDELKARLRMGESFLGQICDSSSRTPAIGDSDDGWAIAQGVSIINRESYFYNNKDGLYNFSRSGYSVFRNKHLHLIFNYSPLGLPPLYNHGHADALSVTLFGHGREYIIDTGSYRYNGAPEYRRYFKSTRAHNTVVIDDLDQAVQETSFIWSRPYQIDMMTNKKVKKGYLLAAAHSGYRRLRDPVIHKREIKIQDETMLIISDRFYGTGQHIYELNFHFHPNCLVYPSNNLWIIDNSGKKIFIKLLGDINFIIVKGQMNPLLGWYSPHYGIKETCGVLNCRKSGLPREVDFTTIICVDPV